MNRPQVTIAMSVRNCENTVGTAIRSVLNQTFGDWELVVIDDGSNDATLQVVRRFQDERIRVFADGQQKGLPTRLNEAINAAAGELLARMDGDDVCYPRRLEVQTNYLRDHPEVNLVGGGVLVFGPEGLAQGKRIAPEAHEAICRRPHTGFPMAHPTYCGRTEWFRRHKYRSIAVRCEDQDMLLRSFRTSRFANVQDIVLGYREGHIHLGKILRSRRYFARMVFSVMAGEGRLLAGLKGAMGQYLKATVDIFAVRTGLSYRLLRHRARQIDNEDIVQWQMVWNANCDALERGIS